MDEDKKNLKIARSNFDKLKIDPSSAAFAEEILDKKLLLKLKKSKYVEDKKIFNLVNLLDKKKCNFWTRQCNKNWLCGKKRDWSFNAL